MDISHPKQSRLIRAIAVFGSFILTLHYRLLYGQRISFGRNFICDWRLHISGSGKVVFGDNVIAWSRKEPTRILTFDKDARITIRSGTRLNGAELQAQSEISIGKNCIIGSSTLVDTDFHSMDRDRATNPKAPVKSAPILISDNVWIAGRCVILKGVTVGENSVVGLGSVVRQSIPEDSVAIGNPAQVVGKI